jgi:hypothetical protein
VANTNRKSAQGKPISSHPLFPAVIALWFGALFGLGSLAIRPSLIEAAVLKTGLDLIVPAAAPPLGMTARILIALIMAALGAAIGATLALRLNRPKTVVRERKRNAANPGAAAEAEAAMWNRRDVFTDGPARRPISAHDELGETLDDPGPLLGRRRALAVEQEEQPFQPQDFAPVPGGEPQIFDIATMQLAPVRPAAASAEASAPLDLGAFPAPAPVELPAAFAPPQAPLDWSVPPPVPTAPAASPMVERAVPLVAEAPRIFGVPVEDDHVPAEFVRAAGFRTSVFETEPAQPLFAERGEAAVEPPSFEPPFVVPSQMVEPAPAPNHQPQPAPADLGMTDLAKRLQESMARRRAAKADATAPAPATATATATAAFTATPEPIATAFEAAPPAAIAAPFAASAEPAFVSPPPLAGFVPTVDVPPAPIPMPAALRPVSFYHGEDHHGEDEDHADLSVLMPRHLTMPAPAPAPIEEAVFEDLPVEPAALAEAEDAQELESAVPAEEAFASLLSIEMPRQEFVRVEEPEDAIAAIEPVVIFPGQMAAAPAAPLRPFDAPATAIQGAPVAQATALPAVDPAEAERALRLALANLQRISGAA